MPCGSPVVCSPENGVARNRHVIQEQEATVFFLLGLENFETPVACLSHKLFAV